MNFPNYRQLNSMDCGPTCLRMIAKYYGKHFKTETLRKLAGFNKEGTTLLGISEAAEKMGFRTRGVMLDFDQLRDIQLPSVLHWNKNHFVVLVSISGKGEKSKAKIADPGRGFMTFGKKEFQKYWVSSIDEENQRMGVSLIITPTAEFYREPDEEEKKLNWHTIFQYLRFNRWQITQVFVSLLIASFLQLLLPFLTQSIVDTGISTSNLNFIFIILAAQLMLIFSRTIINFIRTRILLRISNLIALSLLSDFWIKVTSLPISYFEMHHTGDTLERINDHKRIQDFLIGSSVNTIFSMITLVVFSVVLCTYNLVLFAVFITGCIIYLVWVTFFLGIRRKLDYQSFDIRAKENNATLQLVQGMKEIRLNNAEQLKRWNWENLQTVIFKLNFKTLNYNQIQQTGALLINQGKDIIITFLAAKLVIEGQLTLGAMLAVQYVIAQLSNPVDQIVSFMQTAQDAKISLERLNEIHELEDEEKKDMQYNTVLPVSKTIFLRNLSFNYPGSGHQFALKDICMTIPEGKITAIVGTSGSGKTTLLKLLLKFYDSYDGEIKIGDSSFKLISPSFWRSRCGSVMQDGYIFNDNIARNIVVGDEMIDNARMIDACRIANILPFIDTLPNGFYSELGVNGIGVSQGQRQRLLIARAIYKNPEYLFFDEATNALDANNEKVIVENLKDFFEGRTVIVVAHRLSTVKNADKIIVLHEGQIVEEGTHAELSAARGSYYQLVKNQLELGS